MTDLPTGAAWLSFDGGALHAGKGESLVRCSPDRRSDCAPLAGGRSMMIDARCLEGEPIEGAYAHVCALPDDAAAVPYDQPEVQQVRRDALGWWIGLLGDAFVCLTTLALDESRCAGAITVVRDPSRLGDDPFARLFPPTLLRTDIFCSVLPPAGPVLERYAGVAWPGGRFGAA